MTAFGRCSHRKLDNFEPPPIPGETGSPSNAFVHVLNQQFAGGLTYTLTPTSLLEVRLGVSRTEAGKEPPGVGGPTMLELYGITGLPTDPRFAGGLTEQGVTGWTTWGRQNSNPQFQDPSVHQPADQLLVADRPSELQDRLRVPGDQHGDRRLQPEVRPRQLRRAVQPARRRAAADPATYNLADFMFGARSSYALTNPFIANLRQRMHFAYLQDDFKASQQLTLNLGRALRVRHAAVGEGQLPHQLRSGHQHADPGQGRLDLRPRAGQSRPQQLRAAPRPGLLDRRQDRRCAAATASATSTSTGSAARTCSPSTARTSSG